MYETTLGICSSGCFAYVCYSSHDINGDTCIDVVDAQLVAAAIQEHANNSIDATQSQNTTIDARASDVTLASNV